MSCAGQNLSQLRTIDLMISSWVQIHPFAARSWTDKVHSYPFKHRANEIIVCVSIVDVMISYPGPPSALRDLFLHILEILPAESLQLSILIGILQMEDVTLPFWDSTYPISGLYCLWRPSSFLRFRTDLSNPPDSDLPSAGWILHIVSALKKYL